MQRSVLAVALIATLCSCQGPSSGDAKPVVAPALDPAAVSSVPPVPPPRPVMRIAPLQKALPLEQKKAAIASQTMPTDPISIVRVEVKRKRGRDGVGIELLNNSDKEIVAFAGFVYGFNAMDEPEEIALGGEFTKLLSHENMSLRPATSLTTWWESFYTLTSKTALAEIVKVKFADGSSWTRGS